MSNSKISALTSATTPLAGTEVLPVVQSSATTQVTVANLTAGRAVSATQYTSTIATGTAPLVVSSTTNVANLNASSLGGATFAAPGAIGGTTAGPGTFTTVTGSQLVVLSTINRWTAGYQTSSTPVQNDYPVQLYADASGNLNLSSRTNNASGINFWTNAGVAGVNIMSMDTTGNLIPKVAAKGFNFTANTPAAGMTSQLLNWYEEGTWTPNQGSGLTVVGAFSSTGKYTRIGRQVTIQGTVSGATSIAIASGAGIITSNLPFSSNGGFIGVMGNQTLTASPGITCSTTYLYSLGSMAATTTITFSITYFA